MKKILFVVLVGLLFLAGCNFKQTKSNPSNPAPQAQTRAVHIDSDPEGATVYIDEDFVVRAPTDVKLTLAKHSIIFKKEGYQDYILKSVEVKEDTAEIKVKLIESADKN
ncbi:MAG: PEGA domain-containing protein, partial [Caldisericum sp.]|uniref:PEGA domain-containing protein n=1 Tax=Caldisericum sp. TaxID=2499687 RepID=UPI003D0D6C94